MSHCQLKLTPSIINEWSVRCIGDVIPGLNAVEWADQRSIEVGRDVAQEIKADCEFYLDRDGPDTTVGERSAYRGLLKQIDTALAVS